MTALVDLTADAFSEEILGSGLTKQQYMQLELEHLSAFPSMWNHIGRSPSWEPALLRST